MEAPEKLNVLSDAVEQAKRLLQQGAFSAAVAKLDTLLAVHPQDVDALYMLAVSKRYAGDVTQALLTLANLLKIAPRHARAFQERGHCFRATGDCKHAIEAFDQAVAFNPTLIASWNALADLNAAEGNAAAENVARIQSQWLAQLPPELVSVASFTHEGKLVKAEKLCRHFLQHNGHNLDAMRMLAELGVRFQALDEAEFILESCVELAPDFHAARFDYVNVLHRRQKFEAALDQASRLVEIAPKSPQFDMLYANQNLAVGNFDAALNIYTDLAATTPHNPSIHLTLGHALKTIGRQQDAIDAYSEAYRLKPDFGDAYWSLANLKTYKFDQAQIASMREREAAASTQLGDRYHLCFAIGKALEDAQDYSSAFEYYERGNQLKRDEVGYDWKRISSEIALQIEHTTPELFKAAHGAGTRARDPIFILGLPRAGSTLLEQILASHSQVEGTMELPNILALAHRLDGRRRVDEEARYPANLGELTADELTGFGEAYLRDTHIHRKQDTPHFIDKMPNNFRHIGLIHMIMPNATIIDARRGAMGCCFSGFKQLFAEGQEFTYGLDEIGHYYRDYVSLMAHWDAVLPGKILRVNYEDVVGDIDHQVRRILDHCGLAFEAACVNFHQTERAVRTASSEQVRQPLFTSGLDQWENFSAHLGPLRAVLGPALAST